MLIIKNNLHFSNSWCRDKLVKPFECFICLYYSFIHAAANCLRLNIQSTKMHLVRHSPFPLCL